MEDLEINKEDIKEKVNLCFKYNKDLVIYYVNGKIIRYENFNNILESDTNIYFERTKDKLINKLIKQLNNKNYITKIRLGF